MTFSGMAFLFSLARNRKMDRCGFLKGMAAAGTVASGTSRVSATTSSSDIDP
jgi:hypothetical protein